MDCFNVDIPTSCPGVDSSVLNPRNSWADTDDYDRTLRMLAGKFVDNFKKFEDQASRETLSGGPSLTGRRTETHHDMTESE